MSLARQKIDLWIGDVRVGVVWVYREIMRHSQCRDCCLCERGWGTTCSAFYVIKPEHLYLSPSAALNDHAEKAARQADLMGNEIHADTFLPSSFILSAALRCELTLSVCALTEVQGNYWNIWMTGPSLYPLANDAWLLQKGMGRTLLPLTDISHQRSMTTSTLVRSAGKIGHTRSYSDLKVWICNKQEANIKKLTENMDLVRRV